MYKAENTIKTFYENDLDVKQNEKPFFEGPISIFVFIFSKSLC